jgi:hypothetical protein
MAKSTAVARARGARGRQLLEPGTHGVINVRGVGDEWVARVRVRDSNGVHTSVSRNGKSRQEAIDRLRAAVAARPGFDAQAQEAQGVHVTGTQDRSHIKTEQHVVYRMFDTAGCLLYVGISLTVLQRMGQHKAGKIWWGDIARIDLTHYSDHETARAAERIAIRDEGPLYNIAP